MKVYVCIASSHSDWKTPNNRSQLVERIRRAGLFETVVVISPPGIDRDAWYDVVQQVGGMVRLILVAPEVTTAVALELLNRGVDQLIVLTFRGEEGWDLARERITCLSDAPGGLGERPPLSVGIDSNSPGDSDWCTTDMLAKALRVSSRDLLIADEPWDVVADQIATWLWPQLKTDRSDGLVPTVVVDGAGRMLGLAYSSQQSLMLASQRRRGVYWSRSRQSLWQKGDSSGSEQILQQIRWDCDADTLMFMVRQSGSGFCHLGTRTCFGETRLFPDVIQRLQGQINLQAAGSYSLRLFNHPELLHKKICEEAQELVEAADPQHVVSECADLIYFASIQLLRHGVTWEQVEQELARRLGRVTRRVEKEEDRQVVERQSLPTGNEHVPPAT